MPDEYTIRRATAADLDAIVRHRTAMFTDMGTTFDYNFYTEPACRGRGLARRLMRAIHAACAAEGVASVGLAASPVGRPLYESMEYHDPSNPYMFATLD